MEFEVFRKRGRNWQYLGNQQSLTSKHAALAMGYANNCKYLGVRPAGTNAKLFVHRFKTTPTYEDIIKSAKNTPAAKRYRENEQRLANEGWPHSRQYN